MDVINNICSVTGDMGPAFSTRGKSLILTWLTWSVDVSKHHTADDGD